MVNGAGFGETIRAINGSLECNGGNPGQVQSRIDKYKEFTRILGVPPGDNLSCRAGCCPWAGPKRPTSSEESDVVRRPTDRLPARWHSVT